jgi:hypothetical protein
MTTDDFQHDHARFRQAMTVTYDATHHETMLVSPMTRLICHLCRELTQLQLLNNRFAQSSRRGARPSGGQLSVPASSGIFRDRSRIEKSRQLAIAPTSSTKTA